MCNSAPSSGGGGGGGIYLRRSDKGVTIHWTGPLDWTTGLDYWTHLDDRDRSALHNYVCAHRESLRSACAVPA